MRAGQYDRGARLNKPAYLKLARFEWSHIGREYELGAIDVLMLIVLAALCDYKTGDYFGTISELSDDTRASRRAVGASIERLAAAGLVQVVTPFAPKRQGHLRLLALDRLLLDVAPVIRAEQRETQHAHVEPFRAHIARQSRANRAPSAHQARTKRAPSAHQARTKRAPSAPNDANADELTCDDASATREQAREGVKGSDVTRDNVFDLLKRELNAREVSA